MRVLAEVKKAFFDSDKVMRALDKKTRKVLLRYGSLTRKIAQQSMRVKKHGVYAPEGKPPYAHGGKLLRKFVLFYYDEKEKSTIVGPTLLTSVRARKEMVPRTQEVGGKIQAFVRDGKQRKQVEKKYAPRPYMKPAHDVAVEKVKKDYKGKL